MTPPTPPPGYHIATEEELKCLPEGSMLKWQGDKDWVVSHRSGGDVRNKSEHAAYACPDTPSSAQASVDLHGEPSDLDRVLNALTGIERVLKENSINEQEFIRVIAAACNLRGISFTQIR